MSENSELSVFNPQQMRIDWDRRIAHDYLNWMNDRVFSNEEMWETGKRDFLSMLKGVELSCLRDCVALDLGCGVGRLLKTASAVFGRVIGVDISSNAIAKAKQLLVGLDNVELIVGNGTDLAGIETRSIDLVYCFGAFTHMPVIVFATYLLEVARVMKSGGKFRIQIFLGPCRPFVAEDTAAYRSFRQNALVASLEGAGFTVEWIEEHAPFASSSVQDLLRPYICAAAKRADPALGARQIEEILVPGGEARAGADWPGSFAEYLLAMTRAEQYANAGMAREARLALDYAEKHYARPL